MLLAMAWRNLWRNWRRTMITVTALTLGAGGVFFLNSFRESMFTQMVGEITTGLVGNLQVHGKGYQADPEIDNVVRDPATVEAKLAATLPGAKPERRVIGYGLAGVGDNSSAALVIGMPADRARAESSTPVVEKGRGLMDDAKAANLDSRLRGNDGHEKEALLGRDLAQQLEAGPGSELALLGQGADGSVANDRFTVVGVVDAGSAEMNGSAVYLRLADAQTFFGLGAGVNEIIVRLPAAEEDVSGPVDSLRAALDLKTLEVLSWSEILPELKAMIKQKREQQRYIDLIIILIVGLGVLNTMTMATFERTREFGVMAALGTRRRNILGLVVTEALLQGAIGCAAGLGIALAFLYGEGSLHMGGMGQSDMMGVRMPSVVQLGVQSAAVINAVATAFITVLAGGLWPAIRASRLKPVEAIRHV